MRKPGRTSIILALAGAAVLGGVLSWWWRPAPRVERLILLGFDGASPNLLEPLVAQGKLPSIRRLMETASYGPLRSIRPAKSGVLWTSIATGKTMLKHGILDWTFVNEQGLKIPYHREGRRAKAYWEILAERGLTTGTINWWVSYPPRPVANGYVVSDLFRRRQQPETVSPPHYFEWLNALRLKHPDAPAERERQGIPDWKAEEVATPIEGAQQQILLSYDTYLAQDVTIDRVSDYLWTQHPVRVFSTYFRLVDVTSHFTGHFLDRKVYDEVAALEASGTATAADVERLDLEMARVTAPAYEFMDRIVGKYLDRMDGHTALIVCSDHGFRFFKGNYDHYASDMEAPDGVIFLAGPSVTPGYRIRGASILDVAPTLLHWLGLPVADDMDGTVLLGALQGSRRREPITRIATYESGARPEGPSSADPSVDADVLDDLRTLGYIQGPDAPSPRPSPSPRRPGPR
jgi:predicted AlkP superfamily phosphohydrolase/phosphomutase